MPTTSQHPPRSTLLTRAGCGREGGTRGWCERTTGEVRRGAGGWREATSTDTGIEPLNSSSVASIVDCVTFLSGPHIDAASMFHCVDSWSSSSHASSRPIRASMSSEAWACKWPSISLYFRIWAWVALLKPLAVAESRCTDRYGGSNGDEPEGGSRGGSHRGSWANSESMVGQSHSPAPWTRSGPSKARLGQCKGASRGVYLLLFYYSRASQGEPISLT